MPKNKKEDLTPVNFTMLTDDHLDVIESQTSKRRATHQQVTLQAHYAYLVKLGLAYERILNSKK